MKAYTSLQCSNSESFMRHASEVLAEHQVMHLSGGDQNGDHSSYYKALGHALGDLQYKDEDPATGDLDREGWLEIVFDQSKAVKDPYRHGSVRLPLHTDGSYRREMIDNLDIIFFFCGCQADFGGATTVVDGNAIVSYLEKYDPVLLEDLLETPVHFRKGNFATHEKIIGFEGGDPVLNWNRKNVSQDNSEEVIGMTDRFYDFCENNLVDGGIVRQVLLGPGDALFFHNRRVMHGRCSFFGSRSLLKSSIKRHPVQPSL